MNPQIWIENAPACNPTVTFIVLVTHKHLLRASSSMTVSMKIPSLTLDPVCEVIPSEVEVDHNGERLDYAKP